MLDARTANQPTKQAIGANLIVCPANTEPNFSTDNGHRTVQIGFDS